MPFTQYRITELGKRTIATVNGFLAVLNTWYDYPIDLLTVTKTDPTKYGEPFDFIKYQAMDSDGLISNTAVITINAAPDKSILPLSADTTDVLTNDTDYQVTGFMPFNAAVDRIRIVGFDSDIGAILFEGSNIFPGFELLHYDFESLIFRTKKGTGIPYQQIIYQVGNADGYDSTLYIATFNIVGLASLEEINESEVDADGITTVSFDTRVLNGTINGIAKVNVAVALTGTPWPVDTENFFNLSFDTDDIENNTNFTTDILVDLNNEGFQNLFGQLNINNTDAPVGGTITFTLIDINGNPALVDTGNDQVIITISI